MKHFFKNQNRLLQSVPGNFKRFLYSKIDFNNRLIAIVGPRGVGKTTLLLQYLKTFETTTGQYLYASMDDIYFANNTLTSFVETFIEEYDGKLLILDETHKYNNWNQELKNIYDSYPELRIIFSGSSSLDLIQGDYDLSRRGVRYALPGLSLREFIEYSENIKFPVYSIEDILKNHMSISQEISEKIKPLKIIKKYLKIGYYPYHINSSIEEYFQKINNTIEKTIQLDLARFYSIRTSYLQYFYKILDYLATIPPGKINTNNLSRNLGIANETVDEYLQYMKNTSLIRYLYINARGGKYIRNSAKVFLDNTNLAESINYTLDKPVDIGQIRELFLLNQLQNSGHTPQYIKQGDFSLQKYSFEVGGKNKTWGQIQKNKMNFLILDEITSGENQIIPLYLFGFLY